MPGFGAHNAQPLQHSGSLSLRQEPRIPHIPFIHLFLFRTPPCQSPRPCLRNAQQLFPIYKEVGYLTFAMVVVDEKTMLPPPPSYSLPRTYPNIPPAPGYLHPPPFSASCRTLVTFSDLPSHLLLHIVHRTFPQVPDLSYNKLERQRKTLRWLTTSLRLVNRTFYIGAQLP